MTTHVPSQCMSCRHWISPFNVGDGTGDTQTCDAFPAEIPDDIWANHVAHNQPVDGDHGIRWEPAVAGRSYPAILLELAST